MLQTCPEVLNCLGLSHNLNKPQKAALYGSCTEVISGLCPPELKYMRLRKFVKTLRGRKNREEESLKRLAPTVKAI